RIDGSALPELDSTNVRRTRLVRPSAGVLKITPNVTASITAALSAALGVMLPALWVGDVAPNGWAVEGAPGGLQGLAPTAVMVGLTLTVLMWGFALIFAWAALRLVTARSRFDRNSGRASRWLGLRTVWDVALADIVAVQCLHAGWFGHLKGGWHDAYQLNLVL